MIMQDRRKATGKCCWLKRM